MPKLSHSNLGAVQKTAYLSAVITSVDPENDTACFTGIVSGANIPIYYHCSHDAEERDNGALEGAAGAFVEGDEVFVQYEITGAGHYKPLKVMGFLDKPKECFWEPWCGPEINSTNAWEARTTYWPGVLEITDEGLFGSISNPGPLVQGFSLNWYVPSEGTCPQGKYMFLQIKVDSSVSRNAMYINLYSANKSKIFEFVYSYYPLSYYIGDNDGEPQTIDLSALEMDEPIIRIEISAGVVHLSSLSFTWRFLHFHN